MNRAGCLVGAGILLAGMTGAVEARVVRYEINGKVYVYETTDRQQVDHARQRIRTANAADAAKARADAELASNPVVKLVGSPMQSEAAAAQARLQQVLSQPEPTPPSASPVTTRPSSKLRPAREVASVGSRPSLPEFKPESNPAPAREGALPLLNAGPTQQSATGGPASAAPRASEAAQGLIKAGNLPGAYKPTLRSVTLDLGSGIKTVQMTDGTVHEEPLDSSILSKLGSVEPAAESLTSFVDQVRANRRGEITGTTEPRVKEPPTK